VQVWCEKKEGVGSKESCGDSGLEKGERGNGAWPEKKKKGGFMIQERAFRMDGREFRRLIWVGGKKIKGQNQKRMKKEVSLFRTIALETQKRERAGWVGHTASSLIKKPEEGASCRGGNGQIAEGVGGKATKTGRKKTKNRKYTRKKRELKEKTTTKCRKKGNLGMILET